MEDHHHHHHWSHITNTTCFGEFTTAPDESFPVCNVCGMLDTTATDHTPEWTPHSSEDVHTSSSSSSSSSATTIRCNYQPVHPLLQQTSLSCKMARRTATRCTSTSTSTSTSTTEMRKLRQYNHWHTGIPYHEKQLAEQFAVIDCMADQIGICKMITTDAKLFYHWLYHKQYQKRSQDPIKAIAVLYIACRVNHAFRSAHELAEACHLDKTTVVRGCTEASDAFIRWIHQHPQECGHILFPPIHADQFIERIFSKLILSRVAAAAAVAITNHALSTAIGFAKELESCPRLAGFQPQTIAAAAIYLTVQKVDWSTQMPRKVIAEAAMISDVSLQKCLRFIEPNVRTVESKVLPF